MATDPTYTNSVLDEAGADLNGRSRPLRDGSAPAGDDPGRHESEEQREDRNLMELLQELRVASIGVQVLFGFLLALPFTNRFGALSPAQRHLYVAVLVLTALATAQLSGPVAFHRMVFRQHKKARLLKVANLLALTGLATVGISITGAVLLVTSFVLRGVAVPVLVTIVAAAFVVMWLVIPLFARESPGQGSESGCFDLPAPWE